MASLAAALASAAAAFAVFAAVSATPAALAAFPAAVLAADAALLAVAAAALAVAAASSAGFFNSETGASTTSCPRIAGRLLILSSEVTSASSSTPWLSALIAFRISFFNSVFSASVSAITISPYFIFVSPCNTCMKVR